MQDPEHREKHLHYVGMQATRDATKVIMCIKLGIGALGLLFAIGYFFYHGATLRHGDASLFIAFMPPIIIALGLWDLLTIKLSRFAEHKMRDNDRSGRSNTWTLIAMTLGGFAFLHLVMVSLMGRGYFSKVLQGGPNGLDFFALFLVLGPFVAFAAFMLFNARTPRESSPDMSEEEEVALAQGKRASQLRAIYTKNAIAAAIGVAFIYFTHTIS